MNHLLPSLLLATLPLCATGHESVEPPCSPEAGEAAPGALSAQPPHTRHFCPPSREQVAMRMMIRHLLLENYDADHDLHLNAHERHHLMEDARASRHRRALAFIRPFDEDGDGHLTPEEHEAMRRAMAEQRRAATEETGAHLPPPAHMGKQERLIAFMVQQLIMDAYDADRNGHLDRAESDHLRADGAWLYELRKAELLSFYDANQDGTLSEDELHAALDELMPHPHPAPRHAQDGAFMPPPPPPPPHRSGPINRLLDTHFDIDILLHLAHPQEEGSPQPPCNPSTPSTN